MKNIIWFAFLAIVAFLALWFIVKSSMAVCSYYHLSVQVPVTVEKWSIEELKSDEFAVIAHYSYDFKGQPYKAQGRVGALYPNPWAAGHAENQFSTKKWTAWVNPKHPEKSVLQKKFPYKKAISAAILVALFIYFAILGTYMRVRHGK